MSSPCEVTAPSTAAAPMSFFERYLERDVLLYNRFHALIVINAKAHCRKKPLCAGCPLYDSCGRRGL